MASLAFAPGWAAAFETNATAAYIYDQTTGTVLLSKNADTPLPPASMSKLMTIYMAFEAVADGRLDINEELAVSSHAASFGGSSMFLDTTDRVSVEDLLRGVIVVSGNDASVVLAEALSPDGTESGFARMMTDRARQMGMMNSTFVNSSGWPAAGHRMSMEDLGILANRLITDFPTFYPLFAETEFPFDGRVPSNSRNRNPVLSMGIGADGLKTGHTEEAGFGLVGSAKQDDRRIIFVITGLDSRQERSEESAKIINWAFRQFAQKEVAEAGTRIASADVWMGELPTIGLTVADDFSLLVPVLNQGDIEAEVVYDGPIEAPITAGQQLGELVISLDELPEKRIPLVAEADVARGGFATRMRTAALVLWQKFGPGSGDEVPEEA
ncbi:D-alanyl-D-alanine carboxypeptidase family protein [Roseobacter sp. CCS2]|uniref:D-alanyl-D-alanine carboxypeptidase family protein n=1 Tax=Roseobacter sp. CCS2 TaxID=391593 RepID=UPI0000F3FDD2|nr:D-alanyl-D-alanine carboxypeptidase family protein [Roseobacter sp. CCS2]EBA10689.1 D-alanyl-D-alanine carboxypeptidase [Roseobacter sp. CCS2]